MEKKPIGCHLFSFAQVQLQQSTAGCWSQGLGITKFHQISFKSLNSLLLLNDEKNFNFLKQIIQQPANDRSLKQAYSVLIKPF